MSLLDDVLGDLAFGDPEGEEMQLRLMCMIPGVVMRRDDPQGMGRIIARVDVLFDQGTDWLTPLTQNGGSPNRGKFAPPKVGSNVYLFFPLGSIEGGAGFFLAGGWNSKTEVPTGALVEGDRTRVVEEDEAWLISRDDRASTKEFSIVNKINGLKFLAQNDGTMTLEPGTSNSGLLSEGAMQQLVRGNNLATYLADVQAWLEGLRAVVVGLGGVYAPIAPTVPGDLLSDEWKVK